MVAGGARPHLTAMDVIGHAPLFTALAWVIAALGAFTALDLAERARIAARRDWVWLSAAGLALGAGIWAMQFVDTVALRLTDPGRYGMGLGAVSLVLALTASVGGVFAVTWGLGRRYTLAVAGTMMGLGITAMEYLALTGLRAATGGGWNGWLVLASTMLAIAAATAVLWLMSRPLPLWQKATGAAATALMLFAMHYAATAAAGDGGAPAAIAGGAAAPSMLATGMALMVMGLLTMALALALIDR